MRLINSTANVANRPVTALTLRYYGNGGKRQAVSDTLVPVSLTTSRCVKVLVLYKAISPILAVSWFVPGPQTHYREPPFSYFTKQVCYWWKLQRGSPAHQVWHHFWFLLASKIKASLSTFCLFRKTQILTISNYTHTALQLYHTHIYLA